MMNVPKTEHRKMGSPRHDCLAMETYRGFDDFANGRSYPKEYDDWKTPTQYNYERGRQWGAVIKGQLGFVPLWKKTEKLNSYLRRIMDKYTYAKSAIVEYSHEGKNLFSKNSVLIFTKK